MPEAALQSAKQATVQRRDYGAAPKGPPMSKSAERALAEREAMPRSGRPLQAPSLPSATTQTPQHGVYQQRPASSLGPHPPQVQALALRQSSQPFTQATGGRHPFNGSAPTAGMAQYVSSNVAGHSRHQQGVLGGEQSEGEPRHPAHMGMVVHLEPMDTTPAVHSGRTGSTVGHVTAGEVHHQLGGAGQLYGDADMDAYGDEKDPGDEDGLWDDLRGLESGPSAVRFSRKPSSQGLAAPARPVTHAGSSAKLQQAAGPTAVQTHTHSSVINSEKSLPTDIQHPPATAASAAAGPFSKSPMSAATHRAAGSALPLSHVAPLADVPESSTNIRTSDHGDNEEMEMLKSRQPSEAVPKTCLNGFNVRSGQALGAPRSTSSTRFGARNQRVVIHCDVDCFYCQVERLDDPSLKGVPLAVQQFNSGGFVAVSYEVGPQVPLHPVAAEPNNLNAAVVINFMKWLVQMTQPFSDRAHRWS